MRCSQVISNVDLDFQTRLIRNVPKPIPVSESIASSAVVCARQVNAAVVVSITELGGTARLTAKYRPLVPVIGAVSSSQPQTARQLALNFGIVPYCHSGSDVSYAYLYHFMSVVIVVW